MNSTNYLMMHLVFFMILATGISLTPMLFEACSTLCSLIENGYSDLSREIGSLYPGHP
ncbi:MAG TPA: hypothetical protein PKA00_16620 [Saprospiraceae bacterium]|nr:hypothetical protein [Saprospiraceae bacterium]HMQ84541.1 hypothetical protein [Saprospiraceae bacterium]